MTNEPSPVRGLRDDVDAHTDILKKIHRQFGNIIERHRLTDAIHARHDAKIRSLFIVVTALAVVAVAQAVVIAALAARVT